MDYWSIFTATESAHIVGTLLIATFNVVEVSGLLTATKTLDSTGTITAARAPD